MVLKAYWPLDETSGNTAKDVRGNNDGAVNGATMDANGILGTTAYSFDGTGDYVDLNITDSFTYNDYTFSCWVYPSTQQFTRLISNYDGGPADNERALRLDQNGNGHATAYIHAGGTNYFATGTTNVYNNSWHLLCVVRRADTLEIWVDGVNEDSVSISGSASKSTDFYFGASPNLGDFFGGHGMDVRIYNHALTKQEVQYLYQVGKKGLHTSHKRTL